MNYNLVNAIEEVLPDSVGDYTIKNQLAMTLADWIEDYPERIQLVTPLIVVDAN